MIDRNAIPSHMASEMTEAQEQVRLFAAEMLNLAQRELKRAGDLNAANVVVDAWCKLALLEMTPDA